MKGDFSRLTFRPDQRYSAVLAQQGRVQLDADANEQAAIQLAIARGLAADVIGRHGGPADGFGIEYVAKSGKEPAGLNIRPGRYYVDGMLVDSSRVPASPSVGGGDPQPVPDHWTYWDQPFAYLDQEREGDALPDAFPFLVYLAAWEQLATVIEDPELTETALGAALPDTAARAKVVWQVRPLQLGPDASGDPGAAFEKWVQDRAAGAGVLAARTERPARIEDDPCITAPDAAYRGAENQLYRVEIHRAGDAGTATFKWSRDNGSVAVPVTEVDGPWVTVVSLGRDDAMGLHVGDWTELADDASTARGESAPLLRIEEVDVPGRRVRLSGEPPAHVGRRVRWHPLLRRWDQRSGPAAQSRLDEGAVRVVEGSWIDLEYGVQVWFAPKGGYRTGDHWLIPARTLIADVEWPVDSADRPLLITPHGIVRHFAPLAWVRGAGDVQQLRRTFRQL